LKSSTPRNGPGNCYLPHPVFTPISDQLKEEVKVLIIEDEKTLAYEVEAFLKKAFYICDLAHTARQGLEKLEMNPYDFILLDLGLPDRDGLAVLEQARKQRLDSAFIILTARGDIEDRIKGLDLGADDYLPKPFSLPELQSRMQAVARRKFGVKEQAILLGEFLVDLPRRTVSHSGQEIELTRKEFDLLSYLLLHKNRVLSRIQLSEHIWGSFVDDDYDSNYIDVHIKNIRKKLSASGPVEWLETVRGVGYKIRKSE
jgi:DNA-binding response OmpR family regulator